MFHFHVNLARISYIHHSKINALTNNQKQHQLQQQLVSQNHISSHLIVVEPLSKTIINIQIRRHHQPGHLGGIAVREEAFQPGVEGKGTGDGQRDTQRVQ